MRVVICWSHVSGYIAACFRALAAHPDVELLVVARTAAGASTIAFSDDLMRGVQCELVTDEQLADTARIEAIVCAHKPDVIAIAGWFVPAYVRLPQVPSLHGAKFVMGIDTPRKDTWRQRIGKLRFRRFFQRMDRVIVAGERSWQLAKALGIEEHRIRRGFYGFDFNAFSPLLEQRLTLDRWPRAFLYMGRYAEEKAIDDLVAGYNAYRRSVENPWPLTCCGKGPLQHLLQNVPGISDAGFVQPADQPAIMVQHGAMVLTSRYEPFGVVVLEASAAGMPVLCTEACGATVELVRPYFNGMAAATNKPDSIARGMKWLHERSDDELATMGRRGRELASAYSADIWVQRWLGMFNEMLDEN